jgi:hypothetical protein
MKRYVLLAAAAFGLAAAQAGSANDYDPIVVGLATTDNCGGGFCSSPTLTALTVAGDPFPYSGFFVHNLKDGFGITGESDSGTGLRALGHGDAAALWSENDSNGAGLVARALWGDGIFSTSRSGINKSGVYGESISGAGYGVVGRTNAGARAAVWGDNTGGGAGIEGDTSGNFASAIFGHHDGNNPGFGVWGETVYGQGVVGKSTHGNGTEGVTSSYANFGVWAHHEGSNPGFGLFAHANVGTGVHGDGTASGVDGTSSAAGGVGVRATNSGGGTALQVTGKASFSRSGVVTLSSSAGSVQKTGVPLTSSSYVLATLQTHTSGLSIEAAVPSPGSSSFRIYFNKTAPSGTKVAWFVVN